MRLAFENSVDVYLMEFKGSAAYRRIVRDIREVCDGKWKEQLFTVAIGEHVLNVRGIIISPSEAPTGNYVFTLNIFIPTLFTLLNHLRFNLKIRCGTRKLVLIEETYAYQSLPKMVGNQPLI